MNKTTQNFKNRITEDYKRHPFLRFGEHNELLAMAVDAEFLLNEDDGSREDLEISEVIFAVEKDWLVEYMNIDRHNFDGESVKLWLKNEYTSYESESIFNYALEQGEIVMLEFN